MTWVHPVPPAEDLSPRQARVAQWLRKQVGPGAEAFFRDACGMLSASPQLHTVTHLVTHALREVESAVRAVLPELPHEVVSESRGSELVDLVEGRAVDTVDPNRRTPRPAPAKTKHRTKIRATLDDLGIAHDDAVAEFWLSLAGQEPGSLPSRAHRMALYTAASSAEASEVRGAPPR